MKNKEIYRMLIIFGPLLFSLYLIMKPIYDGRNFPLNLGLDLVGGIRVEYSIDEGQKQKYNKEKLTTAADIMRLRIDALGVSNSDVKISNNNRIIIEIPDVKDPQKAFEIIGDMGKLELRLVKKDSTNKNIDEMTLEDLEPTFLTGDEIEKVDADLFQEKGSYAQTPRVTQQYTKTGGIRMKAATRRNIGRSLAFVLNERIIDVVIIKDEIERNAQISGGMSSLDDALGLKIKLQSGSLPLKLTMTKIEQIGPSLGADIRQKGLSAIAIGLLSIFILMFLVYRTYLGLIANISLSIIFVLIIGLLTVVQYLFGKPIEATTGFTLTLSGIAGLVLTIGMSVDSSILLFEEVINNRERFPNEPWEKLSYSVITNSWKNMKNVILDANITTFIVALVIVMLGSGILSGFAITLSVGLIAAVYVSYFITKELLLVLKTLGQPRYYFKHLENPHLKLFTYRRFGVFVSCILLVLSLFFIFVRGFNLGADFTEGTHITFISDQQEKLSAIEGACISCGLKTSVQKLGNDEDYKNKFIIKTSALDPPKLNILLDHLKTNLYGQIEIVDIYTSGASITRKHTFQSISTIILALFAMMIYTAIRYNFLSATAVVIALIHDVIITLGFVSFFRFELSLVSIAAVLTLIGYSINDSIVVLAEIKSKVREYSRLKKEQHQHLTLSQFIDSALNKVFGRTVMTSFTTAVPVVVILLLGISGLIEFSWLIIIGIIVGTWSSLFIVVSLIKNEVNKQMNNHTIVKLDNTLA